MKEQDFVELNPSDIPEIYNFAVSRIAQIALTVSTTSETYKKAIAVVKATGSGNRRAIMAFIRHYNKLKNKP